MMTDLSACTSPLHLSMASSSAVLLFVLLCYWTTALVTFSCIVCGQAPEPSLSNATPISELSLVPSPNADASPSGLPPEISGLPPRFSEISPSPSVSPSPAPSGFSSAEPPANDDTEVPSDLSSNTTITWCAVRHEYPDCQYLLSLFNKGTYEWSCLQKERESECMNAIKNKEADLMNLDPGLAYIALTKYSMKAVLAEEYCYHSKSYNAVMVVNKDMCDQISNLKLEDFRGRRSCHPGYKMAAGWNYPIQYLVQKGIQKPLITVDNLQADETVVSHFFSDTCAPSELEDSTGLCTSCGTNGSCDPTTYGMYGGYVGAFRCLMEGMGDIAFLRPDTAVRLSSDGVNAQNWSTKSINDFMLLCPDGGCRPVNDNLDSCVLGSVPGNVIMTYNSQTNLKRMAIVRTLMNASQWTDVLYTGHNWNDHLLSASTQGLFEVSQLTRSYLGESATISQSVGALQMSNETQISSASSGSASLLSLVFTSLLLAVFA